MIEFIKTRNVKDPVRNAAENAGIDVFIPERDSFTEEEASNFGPGVVISGNKIIVRPFCDIVIPAGIKSKFPNNIALVANNKSGIATKKKLIKGAQVIDSSYQGEWHIHLINTSDKSQTLEFGQKIVQFVPYLIDASDIVVSNQSEEEFFTEKTDRGASGFGSTGV